MRKILSCAFNLDTACVELRLDEADRAAAADTVRYTEEEVFGRVRSRLHERKAL